MNAVKNILLILGIALLLILLGMWLKDKLFPPTIRVENRIVERPVFVPPKTETKPSVLLPISSERRKREDSLLAEIQKSRQRADSLMQAALRKHSASFEDTIAYADSLGSFFLRAVHEIEYDGLETTFTKKTKYMDAKLTTINRYEERVVTPSPLEIVFDILSNPYVLLLAVAVLLPLLLL